MNLAHAIKIGKRLHDHLEGEDAVALTVLLEAARRVVKARSPLRDVLEALSDQTNLNQRPMFENTSEDE